MRTHWREPLERASPSLFLLAGASLVALLVLGGLARSGAAPIPRTAFWPLFPLAVALSLLGLVGLQLRLAAAAPRSATVGAGFAAAGAALLVGGVAALLVVSPPGPYPGNLGPLGAPFFLGLLAFVPAAALFGLAALRTATPSRRLGGLLLLLGALQLVELIGAAALFPTAGTGAPSAGYLLFEVAVYGLIAAGMGVIGYSLRRELPAPGTEDPVAGPAVRRLRQ